MIACGSCLVCNRPAATGGSVPLDAGHATISAGCLRAAILAPGGLQLANAVVKDRLDVDYQTVESALRLVNCTLAGFQAANVTFKNVVDLTGSTFDELNFLGSVFERVLMLDMAVVTGEASLWSTRMLSGLAARRLRVSGCFSAREMSVASTADFSRARFSRDVTFERAHVGQALFLSRAKFTQNVSFNGADAAHIDARRARFRGDVAMRGTRIVGTLRLDDARVAGTLDFDECQARDLTANWVRCTGLVTFTSAAVSAQITIGYASFVSGLEIDGLRAGGWRLASTRFGSLGEPAVGDDPTGRGFAGFVANGFEVTGDATFTQVDLTGDIEMTGGRFGDELKFEDVQCRSLDLSGTSVAGRLTFDKACRIGPHKRAVDVFKLENVSVAQDVRVPVRVEGNVKLRGLIVQGWLDLRRLRVEGTGLSAIGSSKRLSAALRAQFLNVARDVDVDASTRIAGELDMTGAKVGGSLNLQTSRLPATITLNSATFGAIVLMEPEPAAQPIDESTRIDMVNCAYGQLIGDHDWLLSHLATKPRAQSRLGRFVGRLRERPGRHKEASGIPDRQPFLALERVLRTIGRDKDADAVYFQGRSRTRFRSPWWQWGPQSVFSGYGVKPWRTVIWIAVIWFAAAGFFASTKGAVSDFTSRGIDPMTHKLYAVEDWAPKCKTYQPSLGRAVRIPLQILIPSAFSDPRTSVVDSCPVTLEAMRSKAVLPAFILGTVIVVLKLSGLILLPLVLAMISGLIRPAART